MASRLNDALRAEGIRIDVRGSVPHECFERVLSVKALKFLHQLAVNFEDRRQELLLRRTQVQTDIHAGKVSPTASDAPLPTQWTVAPVPADLLDRRAEICKPVIERDEVVNALNCPAASTLIADLDDAHCPSWRNSLLAQDVLRAANDRTLVSADGWQRVRQDAPPIIVRPRSWNLDEAHVWFRASDTEPWRVMSGSLFDFGLYCYLNIDTLRRRRSGVYFYLCKIENRLEARLWQQVFEFTERYFGVPQGTLRATILIETVLAALEMEPILWEMRTHCVGLNCGRWDYLFSFIKKFHKTVVLGDRSYLTFANLPFLRAYADQLVQICHRHGAYATGGMAAVLPCAGDDAKNRAATEAASKDKTWEASVGFDGAIVAHEFFAPTVQAVFDKQFRERGVAAGTLNQIAACPRSEVAVTLTELVTVPRDAKLREVTEAGVRTNVRVALLYIDGWLDQRGLLRLDDRVEDAATAEISRSQLWHWNKLGLVTADTRQQVNAPWILGLADEAIATNRRVLVRPGESRELFRQLLVSADFPQFMTNHVYDYLIALETTQSKL